VIGMLDQFYTGYADTKKTDLMQYCKLENVLPADLVCASEPRKTMKLQLKTTAFRLLQRIDKKLNALISRLTADLEHNGTVQRHLS
jgi:hypothetical protein